VPAVADLGIVNFGAFLLAAVLLNLTPGVDTLYILGRSVTGGPRVGLVSALGISTGLLVHTLAVALGLSVVLMGSVWLFWGLKVVGACYLVFLGIQALRGRDPLILESPGTGSSEIESAGTGSPGHNRRGLGRAYLQGVMTNVTNPKIALFFLAFLPQFVDPATTLGPLPFLVLGLSFIATSTIWSTALALGAGQFKRLLDRHPRSARVAGRVAGVLYLLLGISIFATPMPN
jgi:threonine/homoserine/homoserine lactone efflux protein